MLAAGAACVLAGAVAARPGSMVEAKVEANGSGPAAYAAGAGGPQPAAAPAIGDAVLRVGNPLAALALMPAEVGPTYEAVQEWDGGGGFYAILAAPVEDNGDGRGGRGGRGSGTPAVLQIVQRLPSATAAEQLFPAIVAAPPSEHRVLENAPMDAAGLARELAAAGLETDELGAVRRRLAAAATPLDSLVVLAHRGAHIVSVEVRVPSGAPQEPAWDRASQVLRTVLARIPARVTQI
jgi:hypothetical protein